MRACIDGQSFIFAYLRGTRICGLAAADCHPRHDRIQSSVALADYARLKIFSNIHEVAKLGGSTDALRKVQATMRCAAIIIVRNPP
jgi:hypothetical protein